MIKVVTNDDVNGLNQKACEVERKRAHLNLHDNENANVQRLLMAMEPETYIAPHRHIEPHKWEMLVLLTGEMDLLIFDDDGQLLSRTPMSLTSTRIVQLPAKTWHTFVAKHAGTLALEIKEGPYIAKTDKDFAPWAPLEHSQGVPACLAALRKFAVGEHVSDLFKQKS